MQVNFKELRASRNGYYVGMTYTTTHDSPTTIFTLLDSNMNYVNQSDEISGHVVDFDISPIHDDSPGAQYDSTQLIIYSLKRPHGGLLFNAEILGLSSGTKDDPWDKSISISSHSSHSFSKIKLMGSADAQTYAIACYSNEDKYAAFFEVKIVVAKY